MNYRQIIFRSKNFMSPYSLFCQFFILNLKRGWVKKNFYSFLLITFANMYVSISTKTYFEKVKEVGKKVHIHFLEKVVSEKNSCMKEWRLCKLVDGGSCMGSFRVYLAKGLRLILRSLGPVNRIYTSFWQYTFLILIQ